MGTDGGTKGFWAFLLFLLLLILSLAISLGKKEWEQREILQTIVPLNGLEYGEELLKEAEKIPGIQRIVPVLKIPARLKAGDYEMDAVLYGVELEELTVRVKKAADTLVGESPALLIGEKALSAMADQNGRSISEEQQRRLLERPEELEISASFSGKEGETEEKELSCKAAGVLETPEDKIFLPYRQAEELLQKLGMERKVQDILLTVKGAKNQEKALSYFQQ